jgi:hypothetical protein
VALARPREADRADLLSLGMAETCLRRWTKQDGINGGCRGLSSDDRAIDPACREDRVQAMKSESLKRATA